MAEQPIRIASNEVYTVSPGGGANGAILGMNLKCGNCGFKFERSYSMAQLSVGFPHEECPNCNVVNYVPFTISGRNDAR